MNDKQQSIADILKSASHINSDVLNCLLLIQCICETPDGEQRWSGVRKCSNGKTLWDMIVQETCKTDGHILEAIKYAIDQIKPKLSLAADLADRLRSIVVDEYVLKNYVHLLLNRPRENDFLPSVFEYTLARKVQSVSSGSGDFYTPKQVILLMTELLGIEDGSSIYDPCCGSGAMLCSAAFAYADKKLRLYGQTLEAKSHSICQMNLLLRGLFADLGDGPANTLLNDTHRNRQFDYILTNPPFNFSDWHENEPAYRDMCWHYGWPPRKNANFAWIQHIISHLSPNGCAVTLLPNGTLTTQNLAEREIRKRIPLDGWIEAIIALPPRLFYTTKIPSCIWVIKQSATRDSVLFVDARQLDIFNQQGSKNISTLLYRYRNGEKLEMTEWYGVASRTEIAQKSYILSPNLYTRPKELLVPSLGQMSEEFNTLADTFCNRISASSLCKNIEKCKTKSIPIDWDEVYLPERYSIFGGIRAKKEDFGRGTPMVDVKTAIHSIFLPETLSSSVELSDTDAKKYYIRRGDVLLNRTSETTDQLACCSVVLKNQTAVYGAYLKRLRPLEDDWVDPRYIAGYFRSKIYRQEIERVSFVYTTRANINLHQLSQVRLYYPSMMWQHEIGKTLFSVLNFKQENHDMELGKLIDRFVEVFIEKFITYPILLFQKGRDQ